MSTAPLVVGSQDFTDVNYSSPDPLASDGYNPDYTPVVPDLSALDLPGQFPSIPGGAVSNGGYLSSDPSGMNVIYTDPAVNPTPTGGYLDSLLKVAQAGMQAFTTFTKGSPQVATPAARMPNGAAVGGGLLSTSTGQTNWAMIALLVAAGLGGMWLLAHYA